jgi:hypothetical protein
MLDLIVEYPLLNSALRTGLVPMKKYNRNYHEFVITAPELRMGICF